MSQVTLWRGDCLEKMKDISDQSVDMVLTDPPYGTTDCKWDSTIPLDLMWEQLKRIIKPDKVIVMTASQPFTTTLIASNMKMFKYCWVWNKKATGNPFLAKKQPLKIHEDVVVFGGKSYYPQMRIGKPTTKTTKTRYIPIIDSYKGAYTKTRTEYYPVSVLDFPNCINRQNNVHPTQKPVSLMKYLIKTYTDDGETVLDFTMGSGTTGVACKLLNRNFIGIELDNEFFKVAKKRIDNTSLDHASKDFCPKTLPLFDLSLYQSSNQ